MHQSQNNGNGDYDGRMVFYQISNDPGNYDFIRFLRRLKLIDYLLTDKRLPQYSILIYSRIEY